MFKVIKRTYTNYIKDQLKKECPLALNFIMQIKCFFDLYRDYTTYSILKICNWHLHVKYKYSKTSDYSYEEYLNLLENNNNTLLLGECKCLRNN